LSGYKKREYFLGQLSLKLLAFKFFFSFSLGYDLISKASICRMSGRKGSHVIILNQAASARLCYCCSEDFCHNSLQFNIISGEAEEI
jgi:hypothetical protein